MTQSDTALPEFPEADFYTCYKAEERFYHQDVWAALHERFEGYADGEIAKLSEGCTVYCHVKLKPPTINARDVVDYLLEHLEEGRLEEYVDPDGELGACWDTEDCKKLRPQLEDLVQRMVDGMRVWSCRRIAAVELTAAQAEQVLQRAPRQGELFGDGEKS